MLRVTGLQVIERRSPERLGHVDVVPVRHAVRPIGCVTVDLGGEFEQPRFLHAIVEPVHAVQIVGRPLLLPEGRQEFFIGDTEFKAKVLLHQVQDSCILRVLVVSLQTEQHDHVGPQVVLALRAADRTLGLCRSEPAVLLPAVESALDPQVSLLDQGGIVQQVGSQDVAFEPVRHLFPPAIAGAGRTEPGIALLAQELADLSQVAMEASRLQRELLAQPTLRPHRADRQLHQRRRAQRLTIARIVRVARNEAECLASTTDTSSPVPTAADNDSPAPSSIASLIASRCPRHPVDPLVPITNSLCMMPPHCGMKIQCGRTAGPKPSGRAPLYLRAGSCGDTRPAGIAAFAEFAQCEKRGPNLDR